MTIFGTSNLSNREIWLERVLKKIPVDSRILDAGAGERLYKRFCTHLDYVSQDFGKYDGIGNRKGIQTSRWDQSKLDILSDITSIPEPDASFDAIMCIEVFEHLPEPIKAIQEFTRLIKPGGYLILTAPFCSLTHFAPYHYYSGFNKYFYEKFLREYNFQILDLEMNGNYFEYLAQELLRLPYVTEKYTGTKTRLFDRIILHFVKNVLQRFSKNDVNSGELLCYGYQIFARKKIL